jgi:hypothetical protein
MYKLQLQFRIFLARSFLNWEILENVMWNINEMQLIRILWYNFIIFLNKSIVGL